MPRRASGSWRIMEREAERMNRLVRDLLSLSRVEAEERVRPTDRVDLAAVIAMAVTAAAPDGRARRACGWTVTGARDRCSCRAMPIRLTQVFQNLIENALKYGAAGQTCDHRVFAGLRGCDPARPGVAGRCHRSGRRDRRDPPAATDRTVLPRRYATGRAKWAAPGWGWRSSSISSTATAGG